MPCVSAPSRTTSCIARRQSRKQKLAVPNRILSDVANGVSCTERGGRSRARRTDLLRVTVSTVAPKVFTERVVTGGGHLSPIFRAG